MSRENKKKAIVLASGGLDSTTLLAYTKNRGFDLFVLSIDYGQKNKIELEKLEKTLANYQIKGRKIVQVGLDVIGGSALTSDILVPKNSYNPTKIPLTYVPCRNTIFLSIACAYAEVVGAQDVFFGAHIIDYSNYPDCRPNYIDAYEKMINLATKTSSDGKGLRIHAPFLFMSKADIIEIGLELGVDYSNSLSCYDPTPEGKSCGECDSCIIRKDAFNSVGYKDPIEYVVYEK
jgi:7-cyano-7-deazaguanine synthase